jgi:hypothetical protein
MAPSERTSKSLIGTLGVIHRDRDAHASRICWARFSLTWEREVELTLPSIIESINVRSASLLTSCAGYTHAFRSS